MFAKNPLRLVSWLPAALTFYLLQHVLPASAHDHHGEKIPEGEAISADPIVSVQSSDNTAHMQELKPFRILYYGYTFWYRCWHGELSILQEWFLG